MITLGGTEAEARVRASELEELASPEFRWQNLLYMTGHDPDGFDPDAPLPAELYDGRPLPVSGAQRLYDAARRNPGLPLRELARKLSEGSTQNHFIGTPEQLAGHITAWQDAEAADGFTIMGSTLPRELAAFAEHVVPILQARRYRTEYAGDTLREHLGLDRPAGYPAASS
jgi:alkanesulfonate monooxygenase SsuD/methylene tetrahydromethanopterin reductase-like flavin-dependent oxidoreductase (luciferase family)